MRPLATLFLILGAADLVAINVAIGPAALADDDPGAEGTRGHGQDRAAAIEKVAVPEPSPMPVERDEPDLPSPRPLAVAAATPTRTPTATPDPDPDPDSVAPDSPHPDALPRPVVLHFDLDSDRLGQSARSSLDRVASLLEDRDELTVDVAGHADESGSQEHNQILSERRAQAVADYLQERGVTASRLAVRAFGELQPLDAARERARKNRRVELRFASPNVTGDPR
jgi:outer membrane protein OmpA-like peptidoglycan-associated protein